MNYKKNRKRTAYHSSSEDESDDQGSNEEVELEADNEEDGEETELVELEPQAGLANVLQKLLSKSLAEKKILAKGITDRQLSRKKEIKAKKEDGDEEEGETEVKKIKTEDGRELVLTENRKQFILREQHRKWEEMARKKPHILGKDKERNLQKIATRGVVQLFNAVKQQQKKVEDKLDDAGPSFRRQEKVLKSLNKQQFIDVLKGMTPNTADGDSVQGEVKTEDDLDESTIEVKDEPLSSDDDDEGSKKPAWNILREDFMLGAKMKDWNKSSEESEDDT